MGQVFLKKKTNISEEELSISDPNIAMQIAQLNKQIADAEKQFNDKKALIKNQIVMLQKKDIEQQKTKAAQEGQVQNTAQNQNNTQEENNGQVQNTNESADYIFRKAIRLSKKLYEERKAVGNIGREIKNKLDDLELSYTMNLQQCKKLARKIEDVLDDNFDKKNSDNKWPVIEREIKKYLKRAEDVNYSNSEKGQVLNIIKDILKDKPEYDWVFGNDNEDLKKEIEDSIE